MQDLDTIQQLRLQLLANGFTPIRNHDKRTFMKGWPSAVIDPGEIARWSRRFSRDKATGIRVEDGLAVIDFDINDEPMMNVLVNAVYDAIPELGDPNVPLLVRGGSGAKEAWFVRTNEIFSRIHSRAWIAPGTTADDGAHRVEIFGGASPRQFGAFGPHTVTDDGDVKVWYRWADRNPADTLKSELPELTKQQFFAIADIVERELKAAGWSVVEKSTSGENDVARVYDLTEDMFFDVDTGDRLSLQQLRELAAAQPDGHPLRCSAAWLEGPSAKRTDRCIVSSTASGGVAVWESASGVTHCEASLKPRDFGPEINRIAEKLKELDERRRNKVASGDGAVVAATKLLNTYAFCPYQQLGVVPMYASSASEGMTLAAFRTMMLPNADEEIGPKGGRKLINPVDIWASSERRITVRGMRMRPDKERPVYEDEDGRWVNTYNPPLHDAEGGTPEPGKRLIEQLLPDETERRWFTQWLAYKVRHPYVPGPAVIMVARGFGTGRGTLGKLMGRLLGPRYVPEMQFHMFAGKSYQSQYDDWGASALMVTIAEASEGGGSAFNVKQDTYTHLKAQVSPEPRMRRYVSKREHFEAMAFTTYFIATNEVDALPIPADDRRFAILSNGDNATPAFWSEINAELFVDANVAAFHAYLVNEVDLSTYNPYEAPPRTDAHQDMVDLNMSDVDRGLELAMAALQSDVYTPGQIVELMKELAYEYDLSFPHDGWQHVAKRLSAKRGYRVGVPKGVNWQPLIDGKRSAVYATTKNAATYWKLHDGLREEVLKNKVRGGVDGLSDKLDRVVVPMRSRPKP